LVNLVNTELEKFDAILESKLNKVLISDDQILERIREQENGSMKNSTTMGKIPHNVKIDIKA
jgi:hypothetical protein